MRVGVLAAAGLLLLGALGLASCASREAREARPVYRLVNGLWFDGEGFRATEMIVEGSRLRAARAGSRSDAQKTVIDLRGGYVVPPFCEAHNHNLAVAETADNRRMIDQYLRDGIFYVQIPGSVPAFRDAHRSLFNRPDSVDATFANGSLTATDGHPVPLIEGLLAAGSYPGFTRENLRDHYYFLVDTSADLDRAWPLAIAQQPDFIKAFLLVSEDYAARRDDPAFRGRKGLDPALAPVIVRRAHAARLRAVFHVETAHDFGVAVRAGADQIVHFPGYRGAERLREEDAALAAQRRLPVHTTTILVRRLERNDPALYARAREAMIESLQTARSAGVNLVIGSDSVEGTSTAEVEHLRSLGIFSNGELLRMWGERCAQAVFPNRRVGRLHEGYEASFLVLAGDPLAEFANTGRILMAMKDGQWLERSRSTQ
jgi:imidazolonepropionase-like amidohydrolase